MIIQKPVRKNYTVITNRILDDPRIDGNALFVYMKLCELPQNWNYHAAGLAKIMPLGVYAIKKAVKTLIALGYIRVTQERTGGVFGRNIVEILDDQSTASPLADDCTPAEDVNQRSEKRDNIVSAPSEYAAKPDKSPLADDCTPDKIKSNKINNIYNPSVGSKSFTELSPDQQDGQTDEHTPEDPELRNEIELAVHRDQLVEEYNPGAVELAIDVIEDVLTMPDQQKVKVTDRVVLAKKLKSKFREMTFSRAKHALSGWSYGCEHTDIRSPRAYMLRLLVEASDSPGSGSAAAAPAPDPGQVHRARRPRQQQNSFHFTLERRRTAEEWADIERQLCDITMRGYSAYASLTNSPQALSAGDLARQMV